MKRLQEIAKELSEMQSDDAEALHIRADRLLIEALLLTEQHEIAEEYMKVRDRCGFYYA